MSDALLELPEAFALTAWAWRQGLISEPRIQTHAKPRLLDRIAAPGPEVESHDDQIVRLAAYVRWLETKQTELQAQIDRISDGHKVERRKRNSRVIARLRRRVADLQRELQEAATRIRLQSRAELQACLERRDDPRQSLASKDFFIGAVAALRWLDDPERWVRASRVRYEPR